MNAKTMIREQLNFLLQQVPLGDLHQLCLQIEQESIVEHICKPTSQNLLVPVHDPTNQGLFYSGEVLVTSTVMRVNGINGWSMIMDEQPELAVAVATLDAAFAAGIATAEIVALAGRGEKIYAETQANQQEKIEKTRVAFDLL